MEALNSAAGQTLALGTGASLYWLRRDSAVTQRLLEGSLSQVVALALGNERRLLGSGHTSLIMDVDEDRKRTSSNIFELLDEDKSDSEVREALKSRAQPKSLSIKSKGITRELPASSVTDRLEAKFSKKKKKKHRKDKLKHTY